MVILDDDLSYYHSFGNGSEYSNYGYQWQNERGLPRFIFIKPNLSETGANVEN